MEKSYLDFYKNEKRNKSLRVENLNFISNVKV